MSKQIKQANSEGHQEAIPRFNVSMADARTRLEILAASTGGDGLQFSQEDAAALLGWIDFVSRSQTAKIRELRAERLELRSALEKGQTTDNLKNETSSADMTAHEFAAIPEGHDEKMMEPEWRSRCDAIADIFRSQNAPRKKKEK